MYKQNRHTILPQNIHKVTCFVEHTSNEQSEIQIKKKLKYKQK